MLKFKISVDVPDYKQRYVERVRTFDVVAKNESRALDLVQDQFDMDFVETMNANDPESVDTTEESLVEITDLVCSNQ